eukprot:6209849-Pleurochrysis_carterae.AAC.1
MHARVHARACACGQWCGRGCGHEHGCERVRCRCRCRVLVRLGTKSGRERVRLSGGSERCHERGSVRDADARSAPAHHVVDREDEQVPLSDGHLAACEAAHDLHGRAHAQA